MNELVSVIIPAYKAEKTIARCLDSVINQTYENIEIILVNDGTVDHTKDIVQNMEDDRIRYLEKKNTGVSDSRNLGIENAQGKYIVFIDADDYVDTDMIAHEVEDIEKSDVDAIFYEYYIHSEGKEKKSLPVLQPGVYADNHIIIENMSGGGKYFSSIWRGIYRAELIKGKIRYKKINFAEDLLFNIEFLLNCERVEIREEAYYHYIDNSNSSLKKIQFDLQNTIDFVLAFQEIVKEYRIDFLKDFFGKEIEIACMRILNCERRYQGFKNWIAKIDIDEKYKDINKSARWIVQKYYVRLYALYLLKKVKNKIV